MIEQNENVSNLADYVERRNRELGAAGPPGRQALSTIAITLRLWADPRTEVELARRAADWPYVEGPALESATRRWSQRAIGQNATEATVAILSALHQDGQRALEEVATAPVPETRDQSIRRERKAGASYRALAEQFGLSVGRVHAIVNDQEA